MDAVTNLNVRSTEIDLNGHVNNAKYLDYLEWGRDEWYDLAELSYEDLMEMGLQTVAVNININFRKECRLGDKLRVLTSPERAGRTSYVLRQQIVGEAGDLRADAIVTCVTIDAATRKSHELPAALRALFERK